MPLSSEEPSRSDCALAGSKYFCTLDLRSGYHQLKLTPKASRLMAAITPHGLFEPITAPFGLHGVPAHFHLRSFIGCVQYFREHLGMDAAALTNSLTEITKKSAAFLWTAEHQDGLMRFNDGFCKTRNVRLLTMCYPYLSALTHQNWAVVRSCSRL